MGDRAQDRGMTTTAQASTGRSPLTRLRELGTLVRFSHTLFALPWALGGLFLGSGGWPDWRVLGLVLVAMVGARTAAMAFNRLVDRRFDATNPRTQDRPSVTGAISVPSMVGLILASSGLFVLSAYLLSPLCGHLSWPVLGILLGYSYAKRFTSGAHWVLGVALGLSPASACLAASGTFGPEVFAALWLGLAVALWTGGFDIFYACQDVDHDRSEGLNSIPARLGIPRALAVARLSHAGVPVALLIAGLTVGAGLFYYLGLAIVVVLLGWQHRLVRPDDLSRVGLAFFQANVAISVIMMVALILETTA